MRQVQAASARGVATADSPAVLNVSDHAFPDVDGNWTGFPKQSGQSLSYWLQGVRCDPLLDHRSTAELPVSADIVVIGSGVSCLISVAAAAPPQKPFSMLTKPDYGNSGCEALLRDMA